MSTQQNGINTDTDRDTKMAGTCAKDVPLDQKTGDSSVPSDIEVKLGELPELPLSDEEKSEVKPIIKREPGLVQPINLDKLIEECKEAYTHCDIHKLDRLEKNLMCLQCEKLICALCLLNSHQQHEIRSVSSMKEYFRVKDTIEDNVSILQQEQNNLTVQFSERTDLKRRIEKSTQNLTNEIDKSFTDIRNVLRVKQEQLITYVKDFESQNTTELTKDIENIRDLENSASRMITRAITFFSKIDIKEASDLPPKLDEVIKKCQQANIKSLPNKEKNLPERKFSKLLQSLEAVASICETIHAEATTVTFSTSTKNSDMDDRKGKIKAEKRKHKYLDPPSDNSKMFKKPKISSTQSSSSSTTSSTLPSHTVPKSHRSSTDLQENGETEKIRRNGDKSLFESLTENLNTTGNACKVPLHRRSVDSSSSHSSRVNSDFDDSESETSTVTPPKLKLVEIKATNIEIGKCLMAKTSEEDGKEEKILLGKIIGSSKMKETTQYTVNWFKGELGKDTSFDIRKKNSPVHSSYVICNFDFDPTKPMSQELTNELSLAKDFYNSRRKTRKRKSLQSKEKSVSPKKDTNKPQPPVKK